MKLHLAEFISLVQILSDLSCCITSFWYLLRIKGRALFNFINFISFFSILFGDIYYNYNFRIEHRNIYQSLGLLVAAPLLFFQLTQIISFLIAIQKKSVLFISHNLSYFAFPLTLGAFLLCNYIKAPDSFQIIIYQSLSVILDLFIWLFCIICLASALSSALIFNSLGCLMIISADLSARTLFIFEPNQVASASWIHIIWTLGVLLMAIGLYQSKKTLFFKFAPQDSLQVIFNAWISFIALLIFSIGFLFLNFLALPSRGSDMHLILWNFPLALMFIIIFSVLAGNQLSQRLTNPINNLLRENNLDELSESSLSKYKKVYEFSLLSDFIRKYLTTISEKFSWKIGVARQVAHDIRSPLSTIQLLISSLKEIPPQKSLILNSAMTQLYDISNDLLNQKNPQLFPENKLWLFTDAHETLENIKIEKLLQCQKNLTLCFNIENRSNSDKFFINILKTDIQRILSNLINNAIEAIADNIHISVILIAEKFVSTLKIEDNGPGIPEQVLKNLGALGNTHGKRQGHGLGLYHTFQTVQNVGGKCTAENINGGGACITLILQNIMTVTQN